MDIKNDNLIKDESKCDDYLIDSHLHLQYFSDDEINTLIQKCNVDGNIKYFLSNSTCDEDFDRTISFSKFKLSNEICRINDSDLEEQIIFPGIGYHPWYLENLKIDWLENLEKKILFLEKNKHNYFIGEIGIDGGRPKK